MIRSVWKGCRTPFAVGILHLATCRRPALQLCMLRLSACVSGASWSYDTRKATMNAATCQLRACQATCTANGGVVRSLVPLSIPFRFVDSIRHYLSVLSSSVVVMYVGLCACAVHTTVTVRACTKSTVPWVPSQLRYRITVCTF
jgi:hypothetical protein